MITIRSSADLAEASLVPALHKAAQDLFTNISSTFGTSYQPENDGYIVIAVPGDTAESLSDRLGRKWDDAQFEGVSLDRATGVWHAVILRDNQFALSILALDKGLDAGVRQRLQYVL